MRIVGIPVIDRHPVQLRAEVPFHLTHQLAGECLEVHHFGSVLWRDDESEMMPVVLAALAELFRIQIVAARPEQACLLSVPGYTLAA